MLKHLKIGFTYYSINCFEQEASKFLVGAGASNKEVKQIVKSLRQHIDKNNIRELKIEELNDLVLEHGRGVLNSSTYKALEEMPPLLHPVVVHDKKDRPSFFKFSELMLMLEDIGLSGQDAYNVSLKVKDFLRNSRQSVIKGRQIDKQIEKILRSDYGQDMQDEFCRVRNQRGRLLVQGDLDIAPVSFSKTILLKSLLAAHISSEDAERLVQIVQRNLRTTDDRLITRRELREYIEDLLRSEVSQQASERYHLLRRIRDLPRPLVIMIGGMSGTGKGLLATEIAYRLGLTHVIGSDSIREVMRAMLSADVVPSLYASTFNAWEHVFVHDEAPDHPKKSLLLGSFRQQVLQVQVGVNALVQRSIQEGVSIVMEGVHLVPGYWEAKLDDAIVISLVTAVRDREKHWEYFGQRGLETNSKRAGDRYKKYFTEIRLLQTEILTRAEQNDVLILDDDALEANVAKAMDAILTGLLAALTEEERRDIWSHYENGPNDKNTDGEHHLSDHDDSDSSGSSKGHTSMTKTDENDKN